MPGEGTPWVDAVTLSPGGGGFGNGGVGGLQGGETSLDAASDAVFAKLDDDAPLAGLSGAGAVDDTPNFVDLLNDKLVEGLETTPALGDKTPMAPPDAGESLMENLPRVALRETLSLVVSSDALCEAIAPVLPAENIPVRSEILVEATSGFEGAPRWELGLTGAAPREVG